jgi:hypothetical protein
MNEVPYRARMRTVPVIAVLLLSRLAAQETGVAAANLEEGRKLLERLVTAHGQLAQMTADYTQFRTTALTKKPLQSTGTLAFRRDPGCVVFRVATPKIAVIRLDNKVYEVWRPEQNRLERFVLASDEMPRLLFDALAPTTASLEQGFAIESCMPVDVAEGQPARRAIALVPTGAATKHVAQRITLTVELDVRLDTAKLCGFGYRDPRGDEVRIELTALTLHEKSDPARFALELPAGAKVTEQRVPPPEAKPAERPAPGKAPEPPKTEGAPPKRDVP